MPASVANVLVIRRRYLGDLVLLGPVFRNLRLCWPHARLTALVEPAYAPVLTLNPDVDEILSLPERARAWPGFLARLRRAHFTHVFDLDNNDRTALITRCTGADLRAVVWHEGPRPRWRAAYTAAVHHPPELHERSHMIEYYLAALAPAGVPLVSRETRLVPRPADIAATQRLVPPGGRRLLVHPGSRSAARIWPAENFAAVCDRVQQELGVPVVLVGGPGEREFIQDIRRHARTHVNAIDGPLTIPQFAALAAQFDLLLCHDSGPMHVAAAVGTPVVALLSSQNPVLFAPTGAGHALLQPPLPCGAACVAPGVCVPGDSSRTLCVRRLTVDTVYPALASRLRRG